jgi:hypothetical protein
VHLDDVLDRLELVEKACEQLADLSVFVGLATNQSEFSCIARNRCTELVDISVCGRHGRVVEPLGGSPSTSSGGTQVEGLDGLPDSTAVPNFDVHESMGDRGVVRLVHKNLVGVTSITPEFGVELISVVGGDGCVQVEVRGMPLEGVGSPLELCPEFVELNFLEAFDQRNGGGQLAGRGLPGMDGGQTSAFGVGGHCSRRRSKKR